MLAVHGIKVTLTELKMGISDIEIYHLSGNNNFFLPNWIKHY